MLAYALVYVASFLVDCIPVFAPPAWTLMTLIMIKFNLNPWLVALIGTAGTVSGRLVFMTYIVPWLGKKTIGDDKEADLKFLGEHLSKRGMTTFLFIFAYSLLPLSSTALFTAGGLAGIRKILIIIPFFLGNLIGDSALLISGKYTFHHFADLYEGFGNLKSILLMAFGLLFVFLFLFIDWREWIIYKKLRLKWQFWR
jgi:membrane protein YqaA with SNARE-associated domain